jgi:hypothetical protein
LCQNCAKMVDNDLALYTVSKLIEWKRLAEDDAKAAIKWQPRQRPRVEIQLKHFHARRAEILNLGRYETSLAELDRFGGNSGGWLEAYAELTLLLQGAQTAIVDSVTFHWDDETIDDIVTDFLERNGDELRPVVHPLLLTEGERQHVYVVEHSLSRTMEHVSMLSVTVAGVGQFALSSDYDLAKLSARRGKDPEYERYIKHTLFGGP